MKIKHIVFDVAGTLLYKPKLIDIILEVLKTAGYSVSHKEIIFKHKLVTEMMLFPDKTSISFYEHFNSELLLALGILPKKELVQNIFKSCNYLSWEAYEDTKCIQNLSLPKSIFSNWDETLKGKLEIQFPKQFQNIFGSASSGLRKPTLEFYQFLISKLDCEAKNILYIGDSLRLDIVPAAHLGINAVLIDRDNIYPNAGVPKIKSMEEIKNWII
jgi:FMN phosphatase YigB (HAD superfamily)